MSGFLGGLAAKWTTEVTLKLLFRRRADLLELLGLEGMADIADLPTLVQKRIQRLVDGADT